MSEQCPTCSSLNKWQKAAVFDYCVATMATCWDEWHSSPSQQSAMYVGVDMAQGNPQYIVPLPSQAEIDSICGVPDGAMVKVEWKSTLPAPSKLYIYGHRGETFASSESLGFGPYESPAQANPLPPSATRHPAISARCLALDCAADYMIGMRRGIKL